MIETEFTDTIMEWFQTLNYEYMILHIIVCYGLYYSKNMAWINQWFSPIRKKGISRGVWLIGGILAVFEIIRYIPYAIQHDISISASVDNIISILHSYVVVQVFVDPIVSAVHKWLKVFNKEDN